MLERFRPRGFGVSISESVSKESRSSPIPAVSPSSSSLQCAPHAHRTHRYRGGVHPQSRKERNGARIESTYSNAQVNKGKCTVEQGQMHSRTRANARAGFLELNGMPIHVSRGWGGREGGSPPPDGCSWARGSRAENERHAVHFIHCFQLSLRACPSTCSLSSNPTDTAIDRPHTLNLNQEDRHFREQPTAS